MTTPAAIPSRPHRLRIALTLLGIAAVVVATCAAVLHAHRDDKTRHYLATDGWPRSGQAAYAFGTGRITVGAAQRPVPIASVAKVMTALVVLRAFPLHRGSDGFAIRVSAADVTDTARRERGGESVVEVRAGEVLPERQALVALLLPSANNVAAMLARRVGATVPAFVARMNRTARGLGMRHTRYTDPSGFLPSTRSTAADQVRLARVALANPVLSRMVALPTYRLPIAGEVRNTDVLLGSDGFFGLKTGSTDAAGSCFVFATRRFVHGRTVIMYGAVLGQPGYNLVRSGQYAARDLVDHVAPRAADTP